MLQIVGLGTIKVSREKGEPPAVFLDKCRAPEPSQKVTERIADGGAGHPGKNCPPKVDFSSVGEKTGEKQNSFSRHRHAAVFQHDAQENRPVPITGKKCG